MDEYNTHTYKTYDDLKPEQEAAMFGCDMKAFRESLEESITFRLTGPAMCAVSMISDAQEMIRRGMKKDSRQTLNRAKWIIIEYLMKKEEKKDGK